MVIVEKIFATGGSIKFANDDVDTESDIEGDCQKPACFEGLSYDDPDDTDIKEEDKACKKCSFLVSGLVDKADGTAIADEECKECQGGGKKRINKMVRDPKIRRVAVLTEN